MVMIMIMVMDMVMDIVSISILNQSMEIFSSVKTSLAPARKIVDTTQNQVMGSFRRFRICLAFDCFDCFDSPAKIQYQSTTGWKEKQLPVRA